MNKLSNLEKITLGALAALFTVLCWNSTKTLNLWGDEAFSLDLISAPFRSIWLFSDNHTPTYFLLLKAVASVTGDGYAQEPLLRMLHVPLFLAGFYFGYKTLRLVFGSPALAALTLLLVILLPLFPYYATNLRMYGLVFLGSMWFVHAVAVFLEEDRPLSIRDWNVLGSGSLLLFSDYAGLVVFVLGAAAVAERNRRLGAWKRSLLLLLPPALLVGALAPVILPNMVLVAKWPSKSTQDPAAGFNLLNIAYNKFRPVVDLADISFRDIRVPLAQMALYGLLLAAGTAAAARRFWRSRNAPLLFILAVSYAYLLTAVATQTSPSRVYLCSQFFMAALIVRGLALLQGFSRRSAAAVCALMLGVSSYMAFHPVPRLNSLLPNREVALDVLEKSRQLGIPKVLVSDNSLNNLGVKRYLFQGGLPAGDFGMLDLAFTPQDLPKGKFLFLSFMGGRETIDMQRFTASKRSVTTLNQYLKLDSLPYNRLWKKHFQDKTSQDYAFVLYAVK